MTFDVEVRGRRHRVDVVRTAEGDHVAIDGRAFESQIEEAGGFWSLLIVDERAGVSRSYEVGFEETAEALAVSVDGHVVPVRLVDRRRARARSGTVDQRGGQQALRAPMPGRIVRVLVRPGDAVVARQGLVVMEAMKMENELHAQMAGIVSEVCVEAGSAVDADALLVVVTAQDAVDA